MTLADLGTSAETIRSHYDLDRRLFSLFLDTSLGYSSGMWIHNNDDADAPVETVEERAATQSLNGSRPDRDHAAAAPPSTSGVDRAVPWPTSCTITISIARAVGLTIVPHRPITPVSGSCLAYRSASRVGRRTGRSMPTTSSCRSRRSSTSRGTGCRVTRRSGCTQPSSSGAANGCALVAALGCRRSASRTPASWAPDPVVGHWPTSCGPRSSRSDTGTPVGDLSRLGASVELDHLSSEPLDHARTSARG